MAKIRDFEGLPADSVDDGFERRSESELGHGGRAWFARLLLWLGGWKVGGPPPTATKFVAIAAPHTAWMDGVWMLAIAWYWGIDLKWMGKASLTKGPLGWLPLRVGVIPVDRSAPHGLVGQVVDEFAQRDTLVLAVPPEGTRAKRDYWKSGFYQIARVAEVPLCLSYLDYQAREAGFGPCIMVGEDIIADMDRMRAFYKAEWAKFPALFSDARLREESMSPVVPLGSVKAPANDEPLREAAQG